MSKIDVTVKLLSKSNKFYHSHKIIPSYIYYDKESLSPKDGLYFIHKIKVAILVSSIYS